MKKADVIFLKGGSTVLLMNVLKNYLELGEKFLGKAVVGSSAGAYVLSELWTDHGDDVHMRKGLGILLLRIVCHYQSELLPPSHLSLQEIKDSRHDLELVLLRDCEHQVFLF